MPSWPPLALRLLPRRSLPLCSTVMLPLGDLVTYALLAQKPSTATPLEEKQAPSLSKNLQDTSDQASFCPCDLVYSTHWAPSHTGPAALDL